MLTRGYTLEGFVHEMEALLGSGATQETIGGRRLAADLEVDLLVMNAWVQPGIGQVHH